MQNRTNHRESTRGLVKFTRGKWGVKHHEPRLQTHDFNTQPAQTTYWFFSEQATSGNFTEQTTETWLTATISAFMVALGFFARYSWMVTGIIGIPGNIITIIISLQKKNRTISTCCFMTAVAVGDTLMLLQLMWVHSVIYWWGEEGKPSQLMLQFGWFQGSTSAMFSSFALAQMSIDRLIVVRFPMSATRHCTQGRANKTVMMTFVLCCLFNLQTFFVWKYRREDDSLLHADPGDPVLESIVLAIHFIFSTVVPFVIIVACNFWIIVALSQAAMKRGEMMTANNAASREKDERYLTRMLIVVCVAYVIISTPYRLYGIVMGIPVLLDIYELNSPYWRIRYDLQYIILLYIFGNNFAVNFYLYAIGGGRKYRRDIKKLFTNMFGLCRKR